MDSFIDVVAIVWLWEYLMKESQFIFYGFDSVIDALSVFDSLEPFVSGHICANSSVIEVTDQKRFNSLADTSEYSSSLQF
ncbi:hypothetical protein WICPIJ_002321 [Wickerhamomyces pijperi]|uniref:Uncharacterized protein n=1 Tax=Wickerhamomyces pijperi TaxID=599730 RepID=A0A9P8Q9X1_WICPI|nr:hypothetical protein WICPIJ_002321 [Wickerhamomyces pijperi]